VLERAQRLAFALGVAGLLLLVAGGVRHSLKSERRLPGIATPTVPYLARLFERGEYRRAERELREALAIEPWGAARHHHNLGLALAFQGDLDGAIRELERALETAPADARIHHDLGQALREKGDLAGAARHFREALELRPGDPAARRELRRVEERRRRAGDSPAPEPAAGAESAGQRIPAHP
jgi:tetratricopeptide (TPR) repeat protein